MRRDWNPDLQAVIGFISWEGISISSPSALVLAGLAAVDAVVIFDEDTPLKLIKTIRPNVLVKGANYCQEEVVGALLWKATVGWSSWFPWLRGTRQQALSIESMFLDKSKARFDTVLLVMNSLKSQLKANPLVYRANTFLKARSVEQKIEREQTYYAREAQRRGLPLKPDEVELTEALRKRLIVRGVSLTPKPKGTLHSVYATRPSNWEPHNIPPELAKFGKVTTYYYSERGFDDGTDDWLNHRAELDKDLLQFVTKVHQHAPVDVFVGYLEAGRSQQKPFEPLASSEYLLARFTGMISQATEDGGLGADGQAPRQRLRLMTLT